MEKTCIRCGQVFKSVFLLNKHFNRKNPCLSSDASLVKVTIKETKLAQKQQELDLETENLVLEEEKQENDLLSLELERQELAKEKLNFLISKHEHNRYFKKPEIERKILTTNVVDDLHKVMDQLAFLKTKEIIRKMIRNVFQSIVGENEHIMISDRTCDVFLSTDLSALTLTKTFVDDILKKYP